MALPKPNCSFTLPSLYDDVELNCRLYYPRRLENNPYFGRGFAIVAHPYAPLGGSYNDPVVGLVGTALLRNGITLATFNFRGASNSAGRTSWSGKAELGDYVTMYAFMVSYISHVCGSTSEGMENSNNSPPILILGGYSYGSMMAAHLPSLQVVSSLLGPTTEGSSENEIKHRAENLSRDMIGFLEMHGRGRSNLRVADAHSPTKRGLAMGGYESQTASRRISRESSRKSLDADMVRNSIDRVRNKLKSRRVSQYEGDVTPDVDREQPSLILPKIAYILISPILPPVAGFTTMFSKLSFDKKPSHGSQHIPAKSDGSEEMTSHPGFCIYGNKDVFTSYKKLQKWAYDIQTRSEGRWTICEVDGAGHFWQENGSPKELGVGIEGWLAKIQPAPPTGQA